MISLLAVFAGGGLGSLCRYGIAQVMKSYQLTFPLATLTANFLSCIILGFMIIWSIKNIESEAFRIFISVGFCGGFSTFSTFSKETYQLFEQGHTTFALTNIFGSIIICLLAIGLGVWLGKTLL